MKLLGDAIPKDVDGKYKDDKVFVGKYYKIVSVYKDFNKRDALNISYGIVTALDNNKIYYTIIDNKNWDRHEMSFSHNEIKIMYPFIIDPDVKVHYDFYCNGFGFIKASMGDPTEYGLVRLWRPDKSYFATLHVSELYVIRNNEEMLLMATALKDPKMVNPLQTALIDADMDDYLASGGNCLVSGGSKRRNKKWSNKYKRSINCRKPKGFSQKQYCKYGRHSTRSKASAHN